MLNSGVLCVWACGVAAIWCGPGLPAGGLAPAQPANLAEFAQVRVLQRDGSESASRIPAPGHAVGLKAGEAFQLEWHHPRAVRAVWLKFTSPADAPAVGIEWWRRIWPDNGSGGWMKLDDPFNGAWTRVAARPARIGESEWRFDFPALGTNEAPGIKRTGFEYRETYKLRISTAEPARLQGVGVFSDAVERRARLRFEWDLKTTVGGRWSPAFEARNGRILKVQSVGKKSAVVEVAYADATNRLSADRGVVICRSGEPRSFAVFVDDVLRERGLFVRDIGAFVSDADSGLTFANWTGPMGEVWTEGTVVEQVGRMPEQSFEQVMQAIPRKPLNYMFLGVPNLRQEIALGPGGDIRLLTNSWRSPGPDTERRPWSWAELSYQFRSGPNPDFSGPDHRRVTRKLEDGWAPVAVHEWNADGIGVKQTSVAAPLTADLAGFHSTNGCEPLVLVTKWELTNTTEASRAAELWMALNHTRPWQLTPEGLLVLTEPSDGQARPPLTPVRGRLCPPAKGRLQLARLPGAENSKSPREGVCYRVELGAGESQNLELAVPGVELLDEPEIQALRAITFAPTHAAVVKFWNARVAQGMTYEVPEQFLNEFFKANFWHVLISTDLDPVTGHSQHGAATHHYKNYLNETMMVVRSLEMRGESEEALKLMEPFLASQGAKGLPGNFQSRAGVLYAAHPQLPDPYTAQGYNMHHGWGLWALAEHYDWTRDELYLRRVAPNLVDGCDWIIRERKATQLNNPDRSRPVEYGLAPAGDLEDVEEYLYWYATDAYYYLGLKHAAAALSSIRHPAGRRLTQEAAAFLRDIQASVAESVATTPVVRLRDGSYVPYVPPRVYGLTHLKEGWIREALYPALHLRDGEVYSETHPYVEWMIQDLEDNIYLSAESGYGVKDPRANFFNLGGFTLQPNLVDLPVAYLKRDQVRHFLRGFYNTAWASLYPETMCFAEWVPAFGRGAGPLYKTPDECKFIQWMRYMLILERGQDLELGLGVPRAWMAEGRRIKVERAATFFGKLDLEIRSHAAQAEIRAQVSLNPSVAPRKVALRLRSPDGRPIRVAWVNGRSARIEPERQLIDLPQGLKRWDVVARF